MLIIKKIVIERFRGIRSLTWQPDNGINVILGAADSGKSTVLEAIALLFNPAPSYGLSEFDYYHRDVDAGFFIEAVVAIRDVISIGEDAFPAPPMQGWLNGKLVDLPDERGAEAVLVCRLNGTPDQETSYEIVGAGGEIRQPFRRALRRRIGLARLGVADRGDRDIRLVQGGALDRYLQGKAVRQTVLQAVMKTPLHEQLSEDPKTALNAISKGFSKRNLPHPVRLGLVGTPGVSLAASVGLTVGASDETALPLTAWGTGTRRLASLELCSFGIARDSTVVVDEPETGLEPYRQREFIRDLAATPRQAFITTHAPAVVAQGTKARVVIWRMNDVPVTTDAGGDDPTTQDEAVTPSHRLTPIVGDEITAIAGAQSEALFAKLPIVCEGVTEVGFANRLLEKRFGDGFSCRGVFCVDAGGHDRALPICQQLTKVGYSIAAIVDDEGKKGGSWASIAKKAVLLRWKDGACLEAAVLSVLPDDMLCQVHEWVDQTMHRSAVHQLAEIRNELKLEKGLTAKQMFEQTGRDQFLAALLARACPKPEGKRKPRGWFKTFDGGYLLAEKLISVEPRSPLMEPIEAFLENIAKATTA